MNLIYYSVGVNKNYLDILNLHLRSLEKYYSNDFEILFIVDQKFSDVFQESINTQIPYRFLFTNAESVKHSSLNKLKIGLFTEIDNYEKILYCDCDTIWCGSPMNIFNTIISKNIYVSNELHHNELMTHQYYSNNLLNDLEKSEINNQKIRGFNAGVFGFDSKSINIINRIFEFSNENIKNFNECIEQPYFNIYLFRDKMYEVSLNGLVSHNGYNMVDSENNILVHFAGGPGNHEQKLKKMSNFYERNK